MSDVPGGEGAALDAAVTQAFSVTGASLREEREQAVENAKKKVEKAQAALAGAQDAVTVAEAELAALDGGK